MQIIKTEAFVLKSFKYGETSKIVTLFTKDFGKLNAIVKGVRNFKSKFCGTMESMNYINTVIYLKENRDLQLVTNAEYIRSFPGILRNFDKIEEAFRIIEILNRSFSEHYTNKKIFELIIMVFSGLEKSEVNYSNYTLYFIIQLTRLLGLSPEFSEDYTKFETFFSINEFQMDGRMYCTLFLFYERPIENIASINEDPQIIGKLINNCERFISLHTQGSLSFKTNKVFKELNINI